MQEQKCEATWKQIVVQLCTDKFQNLSEMDDFLEKQISKVAQKKKNYTKNLNTQELCEKLKKLCKMGTPNASGSASCFKWAHPRGTI